MTVVLNLEGAVKTLPFSHLRFSSGTAELLERRNLLVYSDPVNLQLVETSKLENHWEWNAALQARKAQKRIHQVPQI